MITGVSRFFRIYSRYMWVGTLSPIPFEFWLLGFEVPCGVLPAFLNALEEVRIDILWSPGGHAALPLIAFHASWNSDASAM